MKMNEYVPYEIAQLLEEKGFKITTDMVYDNQKKLDYQNVVCWRINRLPYVCAPTYQSVFAWFRTFHIYAWIEPYSINIDEEATSFKYCMFVGDNYEESDSNYPTFEEASDECINYICKHYI